METAARVYEVVRRFTNGHEIGQAFTIDSDSQCAIDAWLDESLLDPNSKFSPLLELASEAGSEASIPSRVARWLLKGTQRGGSVFNPEWKPPIFDDAWYDEVSANPVAAKVAARFIREVLGVDQGSYGSDFVKRLDRFAPNLTAAYLDAARHMVGGGFELNADAVAAGAVRDLEGFESIVLASLDDLASIHRQHVQNGREEWRAIEDGERDHAAEEAEQFNHQDDGYLSGLFIDAYIRQIRSEGRWPVLANHPRVAELIYAWSHALQVSRESVGEGELRALLLAGRDTSEESNVWAAVREHWHVALEPALTARIGSAPADVDLCDELVLTALKVLPNALVAAFQVNAEQPGRQVALLTAILRVCTRLGKGECIELRRVANLLPGDLKEALSALPRGKRKARKVNGPALSMLTGCATQLGQEALDFVVPTIIASGGDASQAIRHWLTIASGREYAVSATEAAIAIGDSALVWTALQHRRADARRLALLYLAPTLPDPLPPSILTLVSDPGSRVRRALVALIRKRPHQDHLATLLVLIRDTWSSAEPHHDEPESFDIAQDAVVALAEITPLSDAIGDTLIDLANSTVDRTLSQYLLIVAANRCSAVIQQKIAKLVDIPQASWIRLDALDALAGAETVDPSIVSLMTSEFLLNSPPILAAPAAHLVGAHASAENALKLFDSVASSNKRRALLLVGANAIAKRDRATADRILDLLELGHPGRQLLMATETLPASTLDDLGDVQLRDAVRNQLGGRMASLDHGKVRVKLKPAIP
jgi:hypothetical protein